MLKRPGGAWKGAVEKALLLQRQYDRLHHDWDQWHQQIARRLKDTGLFQSTVLVPTNEQHFCPSCTRTFATKAAWAVHAFKLHGRVTPARSVAEGTQCSVCLKQYESYVSLVHHLRYSATCFAVLSSQNYRPAPAPGWNSREELRGRRELRCPHVRAAGPTMPLPVPDVTPLEPEAQRLCDEWTAIWRQRQVQEPSVTLELIRQVAASSYLTANLLRHTAYHWLCYLLGDEDTTLDIIEIVHDFMCRCRADWFIDAAPRICTVPWRDLIYQWSIGKTFVRPKIPRSPAYRPVTIAHLFSGHRRPDDLQSVIEGWGDQLQQAVALSVDIIFSIRHGDLMNPDTQALFCRAVRDRVLHGIVAGPPCETWSVARTHGDDGPRPLRDTSAMCGLGGLTLRELLQLFIGNGLLGAAFILFLECLLSGCFMLIEHPDVPEHKPTAASIWRLDIVAVFLRFCNCALYHIHQGYYGAASAKPTAFLIANGTPNAAEIMAVYRTQPSLPSTRSIGKDPTGRWKTTSLKAYPAALCRAIVSVLNESLRGCEWNLDAPAPAWFTESVEALNASFDYDAQMGPDFAGGC